MDYDRLRELQEKFEENPRRYFAPLANEYRKGGQPKRAIEICRAQLAQMPGHMSGQIVYGQALYEAGEFDEAREVFQRALTLDPENLIALRSLGDMSLQSGNTVEARSWYTRLLDADPKDTAVIALVSEIDASADAVTPVPEEIPGVDTDAGDQQIPFITDAHGGPVGEGPPPSPADFAAPAVENEAPAAAADTSSLSSEDDAQAAPTAPTPGVEAPSVAVESAGTEPAAMRAGPTESVESQSPPTEPPPPDGLERHYPVESREPAESREAVESPKAAAAPDSADFEQPLGAEGLQSRAPRPDAFGTEALQSAAQTQEPVGAEGLSGTAPADAVPEGTEGLQGTPPPTPLAGATASRSDDENALDSWTPPPGATVHEQKEDRMFSGPAPEPFVNETMAQLYLQQGYRQLALRVYYQLAETRPDDQALKERIAQIRSEEHTSHPEEAPAYDRTPADSPPPARPSRGRESVESPRREEPREREVIESPARGDQRAEPEGIAARQPSIKEFFATLGRRRPPRTAGTPAQPSRAAHSAPPPEPSIPLGSAAPSATLDAVFAGASVNPADSRAASRLAGAFSGTVGTSRTTPPTPPMPTPRVNPRVPAAQESEEDVAKFRAWLDGLTGE